MSIGALRAVDDVSSAKWIAPRLSGRFGAVGLTVPRGYPAYARICHPAGACAAGPVSWSDVARFTGRRPHALMQWGAIAGAPDRLNSDDYSWPGAAPERGDLDHLALSALCDRIAEYSVAEPDCFFCLWEGYSGLTGYGWLEQAPTAEPAGVVHEVVSPDRHVITVEEISRSRLHLPDRDYVMLAGPLRSALQIGHFVAESFRPQSPNLFWPADRTWCVASEIDFDSTLVGGPIQMIDAILHTTELDTWPVEADDSLACNADKINAEPAAPHSWHQPE